jgi:DNA-binding transcriptional ArsR family regulator
MTVHPPPGIVRHMPDPASRTGLHRFAATMPHAVFPADPRRSPCADPAPASVPAPPGGIPGFRPRPKRPGRAYGILETMLRLHLTFEDLARVRIAETAHRGTELLFSLDVQHTRPRDLRFHRWLRTSQRSHAATHLSQLLAVQALPGFLCPLVTPDWQDTILNATRADPGTRRSALQRLAAIREPTPFARALADNQDHARNLFARSLGAYQRTALDDWMPQVDALVSAERRDRERLAAKGPGQLLRSLHPLITWEPPVLNVASALDGDVDLNGRGLTIQPTVFGLSRPWFLSIDAPRDEAVLFIPLRHLPPLGDHEPAAPASLIRLLGRTRATVLRIIADDPSAGTGNIARHLDCSPATISEHTTVLRDSGLITTVRDGQSVQHTVTDLGTAVLRRGSG